MVLVEFGERLAVMQTVSVMFSIMPRNTTSLVDDMVYGLIDVGQRLIMFFGLS